MNRRFSAKYLELLVDALQAINCSIQSTDLITLDVKLQLEILDFTNMCITLRSILCFELVLYNKLDRRTAWDYGIIMP